MRTTKFSVIKRKISQLNSVPYTGEYNIDTFQFEFDDEWDGLDKTLVLISGEHRYNIALLNDQALMPFETYQIKGDVKIGLFGTDNGYSALATGWLPLYIEEDSYEVNTEPDNLPSPTQWDLYVTQINILLNQCKASQRACEAILEELTSDYEAYIAEFNQIKEDTEDIKDETQTIKNETNQIKNDVIGLKNQIESDIADAELRIDEYNANAQTKTNQFNQNATEKTNAFNSNAESKTNTFNSNYTEKLGAINTAGSTQVSAVNSAGSTQVGNVETAGTTQVGLVNTAGTTAITNIEDAEDTAIEHIQEEGSSYDTKIAELYDQIPKGTVEGEAINVQDSSNLQIKDIEIIGNTKQDDTKKTYKCDGTETGDYYFTYDNVNYQFTMPTVASGDLLVFDTTTLKLYKGTTEIATTTGTTGTLITLTLTPNPDYSSNINVVTGDVTAKVIGKQLIPLIQDGNYGVNNYKLDIDKEVMHISIIAEPVSNRYYGAFGIDNVYRYANYGDYVAWKGQILKAGTYTLSAKYIRGTTSSVTSGGSNVARLIVYGRTIGSTGRMTLTLGQVYLATQDGSVTFTISKDMEINVVVYAYDVSAIDLYIKAQLEVGTVATSYESYIEQTKLLSLGSMELCSDKNGNYRDCLFKAVEGDKFYDGLTAEQKATLTLGKWYKYKIIKKGIFDGTENWYKLNGVYTYTNGNVADMLKSTSSSNIVFMSTRYRGIGTRYRGSVPNLYICKTIPDATNQQVGIRDDSIATVNDFSAMLSSNNLPYYYILETPVFEEITDTTLIAQLDALYDLETYKNITNIFTTTDNEDPILGITYYKDLDTLTSKIALLEARIELLES